VSRANRRESNLLLLLSSLLGIALVAACGGKAVVDGSGGNDGSGTSKSTGASPVCFTSEPSSELFECGFGTTGSGAGPCERRVCDTAGNEWRSSCEDKGCVCFFNGSVKCSCVIQGDATLCDGVTPSCCPEPFPPF